METQIPLERCVDVKPLDRESLNRRRTLYSTPALVAQAWSAMFYDARARRGGIFSQAVGLWLESEDHRGAASSSEKDLSRDEPARDSSPANWKEVPPFRCTREADAVRIFGRELDRHSSRHDRKTADRVRGVSSPEA